MAIRKILTIPDSILRQKSLPVDKVNKEIKALMDDMLEHNVRCARNWFSRYTNWYSKKDCSYGLI